ncbi:glutamate racemase [Flavobacterium sp.]
MTNTNSIGLFDSGIGGTSIWAAIHALLPAENTIYLADSKNAPYGQKTKDEIIALSIKNTQFLLEQNCKIIVVACNTATTNAIKELRAKYDVPIIGIEPAIKPAAQNSATNTIGILATRGTLNSELFHQTILKFDQTKIVEQIGHHLVTLIENGELESPQMKELLKTYLKPMIESNIDYLVLGCSHYPYLIPQIKKILPKKIKIIDSGEAVARQTKNILQERNNLNSGTQPGKSIFYTNADPKVLEAILKHKHTIIQKDF